MDIKDSKAMLATVAVILVGGVGFYGGTLYQKSVAPKNAFGDRGGNRSAMLGGNNSTTVGQRTGGVGFRPVVGEILSKDDKSITVKLADGSSKIVLLSDTTAINRAEKTDTSALTVGDTVRVIGTTNTDGSIAAQDIQLNPELRGQNQPAQ